MIVDDFQKLIENNKGSFSDDELGLFKDYPDKMTVELAADVVGGRRSHL